MPRFLPVGTPVAGIALVLALAPPIAIGGACAGERERPGIPARHLLLVTVAGLRADHVSAYMYPRPTTHVEVDGGMRMAGRALGLDDLAAEGVLFARAFAPAGEPLAALASLHLGRPALESGVLGEGDAPPAEGACLAAGLAAAGFDCVAFVAHPGVELAPAWRRGFARFEQVARDQEAVARAISWVGDQDFGNDRPTFLWLHLSAPRAPFDPPSVGSHDFAARFGDPTRAPADAEEERALALDLYDGEIAFTTHLVHQLLDFHHYASAPAGGWQRTLFVFAGAGGLELPGGGTGALDDGVLRVPLFLRHPDSLTGQRIFLDVVTLEDVAPTLLEWFGAPGREAMRGRSLLALTDEWRRRELAPRPAFAARLGGPGANGAERQPRALTARDAEWRLVWRPDAEGDGAFALFHQARDPLARQDLAEREPERCARMRAWIEDWLRALELAPAVRAELEDLD